MQAAERAGHGLHGRQDGGVLYGLRLKLTERGLYALQGPQAVLFDHLTARALYLVQGPHGLGDGRGAFEQMARKVGVSLQSLKPSRERLARGSGERDYV